MKKSMGRQTLSLICKGAVVCFGLSITAACAFAGPENTVLVCFKGGLVPVISEAYGAQFELQSTQSTNKSAKRAEFGDVSVEKPFDNNSPSLFRSAASGSLYATVEIVFYPSRVTFIEEEDPPPDWSMKIELHSVSISGFSNAADADKGLFETLSLAYQKICLVSVQDPLQSATTACWDVARSEEF